ncbi:unnamed protein product [Soboliphyme baturini]|uniref:Nucleoporin Ndc1 n=1 Tax=Soboliphyme baturini TaxID=241478 RepID=A0A183IFM2_9BILA|nr:unnamed protein product [Soboliphyme baturini]
MRLIDYSPNFSRVVLKCIIMKLIVSLYFWIYDSRSRYEKEPFSWPAMNVFLPDIWTELFLLVVLYYIRSTLVVIVTHLVCRAFDFPIMEERMPGKEPDRVKLTLTDALQANHIKLLKYLAFCDLLDKVKHSVIAKPCRVIPTHCAGGHPYVWNIVSRCCIECLQNLITNIEQSNDEMISFWERKCHHRENFDKLLLPGYMHGLNLHSTTVKEPLESTSNKPTKASMQYNISIWEDWILQTWNIEILGVLLSTAYVEDKYGLVQKDLNYIITMMLNLHSLLNRHCRLSGVVFMDSSHKRLFETICSRLRTQLEASLTIIRNTYGTDVREIGLDESKEQLLLKLSCLRTHILTESG